jgi:hypothetical protein
MIPRLDKRIDLLGRKGSNRSSLQGFNRKPLTVQTFQYRTLLWKSAVLYV